ncbi:MULTISPECIES: hypothetical protein [unclassified Pseudomonas]|uniref:hypothetical protein n=1 Tax=unclassified Pseudomonas TaxID=196821 RepID=UPI001C608270|nr:MULTISPECIES: hypothetical protein [unclassified Pseudomonas]MBW5416110.1 hypothetical protein [Pseudomonas sp. MAG002Y]
MVEASTRTVLTLDGKDIIVRELTVKEIRESVAREDYDLLSVRLFDDLRISDIAAFTSLSAAEIEDMTPSQLEKVRGKIKEMNTHFFAMLARLAKPESTP